MSRVTAASLLALALALGATAAAAQQPQGADLRVSTRPSGLQWAPAVAARDDGSFVVVWRDGADPAAPSYVVARLFDAQGRPATGEIRVARVTPQVFGRPAVAVGPDGGFVVVWAGGEVDPRLAFGRRFAANGSPHGPRFRLARSSGQAEPDVAVAADGGFVVVWTQAVSRDGEPDLDVFLRRFTADGRPRGPEAALVSGELEESGPRVALRPGGDLVVAWEAWGGESSFFDVKAGLFSAAGAALGDELAVHGGPSAVASQHDPAVAVATDGSFAVVWTDRDGDPGPFDPADPFRQTGVKARFYAPDGGAVGPERRINSFRPGSQEGADVAATPEGGYFVVWASGPSGGGTGQDGDAYGVYGRAFAVDGSRLGGEVRINRNPAGSQHLPALALAASGRGAVAWTIGGLGADVFARRVSTLP